MALPQLGLSQEQLAAIYEQQQSSGGMQAQVAGVERFYAAGSVQSGSFGLYDAVRPVVTSEPSRLSYGAGAGAESLNFNNMPIRRVVDRIGGEAVHFGGANYSSAHIMHVPQMNPSGSQYYPLPVQGEQMLHMPETLPSIRVHAQQAAEYTPSLTALGYVPCDVLPMKAAIVHDIWSSSNFCEEVCN